MCNIKDVWNDMIEICKDKKLVVKRRLETKRYITQIIYDDFKNKIYYEIDLDIKEKNIINQCKEVRFEIDINKLRISSNIQFSDIFIQFLSDIYISTKDIEDSNELIKQINMIFNRWKYFFAQKSSEKMSKEKIIGLWGELEFLKYLILNGVKNTILLWEGPKYYKHDFVLDNLEVEVKTIVNINRRKDVYIHGTNQLECKKKLYLCVNTIKEATIGNTLKEQVEEVEMMLEEKDREVFYSMLLEYGYIKEQDEKTKYELQSMTFYIVDDNFPRYRYVEGLGNVEYTINTEYICNHIVKEVELQ